jgi:hypothetical protein
VTDPNAYPVPPSRPATARTGRYRPHEFPARPFRIAPTFTTEEYDAITKAAIRIGLTPTGFCAQSAIAAAIPPAPHADPPAGHDRAPASGNCSGHAGWDTRREALAAAQAELAETRTAVVRIGINLNQAVRILNATGEIPVWLRHVAELCARTLRGVDDAASRVHRLLP